MIKRFLIRVLWFIGRHTRIHLINKSLAEINYRNILDASINRGTWKGNELTQIGGIYQNLNNMIDNIVNQVSAQVNEANEESNEANEESNEETKEGAQEA